MRDQNSELQDKVETSNQKKQSLSDEKMPGIPKPDKVKPSERSSLFDKNKLIPSLKTPQSSTDNLHVNLYVDLFDSYVVIVSLFHVSISRHSKYKNITHLYTVRKNHSNTNTGTTLTATGH